MLPFVKGDIRLEWRRMLGCEALRGRLFQRIMKNKMFTYEVAMNCKTFASHIEAYLCFLRESDDNNAFSIQLCNVTAQMFCHYVRRQNKLAFETRVEYYKNETAISTINVKFTIALCN